MHVRHGVGAGDGLAIGHLRCADVGAYLELSLQAIDDDLQVQLAHAGDHGLAGLVVYRHAERRVLGGEALERLRHALLIGLGLGLDGDLHDGIGKGHALQHHRPGRVAQGLARACALQADDGDDVAGARLLHVLAVVGVHSQHAADALAPVPPGIENRLARGEDARIDAHERERADEGIAHHLERQGGERLVVPGLADDRVAGVRTHTLHVLDIGRGRQELHDRVEQRLYPLVLEGGAVQHRDERPGQGPLADAAPQGRLVGFGPVQVGVKHVVVGLHGRLDQPRAVLRGPRGEVGGDGADDELGAQRLVLPDDGAHRHQVDEAPVARLRADGKLENQRRRVQPGADHVDAAEEVGADAVHLVDEADARHAVAVGLPPHRLRLRLDPGDGVEDGDRPVEDAQRALHLDGEVHVPRRIDDVDPVVAPEAGRGGGCDGDTAFLLLLHPVHDGGAVVDLAEFVAYAGVEQDAFGRGGLAGIDVCHDADVAVAPERRRAGHGAAPTSGNARTPCWRPPCGGCLRAS